MTKRPNPKRVEEAHVVLENAMRWTSNILVEVQANHGEYMPQVAAEHLRQSIRSLHDATMNLRFPDKFKEPKS